MTPIHSPDLGDVNILDPCSSVYKKLDSAAVMDARLAAQLPGWDPSHQRQNLTAPKHHH